MSNTEAIVLFGHGARDPQWAEPMKRLQGILNEALPHHTIDLAFLELMAPTLPECVDRLVGQGVKQVQVVPIFFGKGGHLKNDFPVLLDQLRQQHPALSLSASSAVGQWDAVWLAIAGEIVRATQATSSQ